LNWSKNAEESLSARRPVFRFLCSFVFFCGNPPVMSKSLEVLFSPAEFEALASRDLSGSVCIVFDILRATTTMMTALAHGAEAIIPVVDIPDALAIRHRQPDVLLAGEREGLRILSNLTGGVDFDLGNSPREFTAERVAGKTIVATTTNGTRALRACSRAKTVLIGSFLNLRTIANWIDESQPEYLFMVCAGTHDQAAYEDALAAGGLCDMIWPGYAAAKVSDSAEIARQIYRVMQRDLLSAMQYSRNGRRLLAIPDLHDDVRACVQRETLTFLAGLGADGVIRKVHK
jgi:2-phosphosulfolactate phosphatase